MASTKRERKAIPVTITLDLEYHRNFADCAPRVVRNTRMLLEFLGNCRVRATVFAVGRVAADHPDLIREVAAQGHELASHGLDHRPIDQMAESVFRSDIASAKAMLEDISGTPVSGFRAPVLSLTRRTPWAPDALLDLGFGYSSSVMPAANPLYGDSSLPASPFRWPNGLLELPCPVYRLGPLAFPYLGGIYMRYLPASVLRHLLARRREPGLWSYCHPYDFDADEGWVRFAGAGRLVSLLLSMRRRGTYRRLRVIEASGTAPPLAERVAAGEFADAPLHSPATPIGRNCERE